MRIFVTGGAGFIGRYCVRSFLEKNYKVTIFDNLSNSSEGMISDLLDDGVKLVKGDITIQDQVSKAISGHDAVIHLAAKISVQDSISNPHETIKANVEGTINLLNACNKNKIKNFIAASSAAVYGDCEDPNSPIAENSKTVPLSPYAASKLQMEQYIKTFANNFDMNTISLRFFNIYGIGQSPEYAGVITKFLEKIAKNESLKIFGDGLQTRDFVAIQDAVDSISNSLLKIEKKRGAVYNIGSGKAITIKSLAELMISLSGKKLDIKYLEPQSGDIRYSLADISLAKKDLDYDPKIKLKDGVSNLLTS